jgi:formiminotetrahydrofolate cyclodeaminase
MTEPSDALASLAAELAQASPPVGVGVVAAGMVCLAAGLTESIARASGAGWTGASGAAVQALTLRRRAEQAGSDDTSAYALARAALARSTTPSGGTGRDGALRGALIAAADALLAIAATAADCATLAAETAAHCEPAIRADAAGAADMAAAAAGVAASLVEINLALGPSDERRVRARELVRVAESARHRAREAG